MVNGQTKSEGPPRRKEVLRLWQLLVAVLGFHALLTLVLSPRLFRKEDTSPEGLLAKARTLATAEKYAEAAEAYQQMLLQKPQIPAIFVDAEKEMNKLRLKALEAQKKKESEATPSGKPPEGRGAPASTNGEVTGPSGTSSVPKVALPSLPDIGGNL